MTAITGFVAPGFERVRDAFARNFAEQREVGAAVAAWSDGEQVVSLWGGLADPMRGRRWCEDTLVMVFSMTKALTTTCVHHLVERGGLELDAPVARYWPEFAQNGKQAITVRMLLSHRAGLPVVEGEFTLEQAIRWTPIVDGLAAQKPLWEPDSDHGYHLRTFGWLVGEVFWRASGRTVGRYFEEELADPLQLDWYLGLPASEDKRVAQLVPPAPAFHAMMAALPRDMLLVRATSGPSNLFHYDAMWNRRALRAIELPSSNSLATAAAVARLYAALLWDFDGKRALRPETVAEASRVRSRGRDRVLMTQTAFGSGFQVAPALPGVAGPRAFGHIGAGGALGFADPDAGLTLAYAPSRMRFDVSPDPRGETLARALYAAKQR
jgi:CubicO group peptidase (beta-lactamase class C family)